MAPYCTPDDLAGRVPKKDLVQLVSNDRSAVWEDASVQAELTKIIAQAQDKVDAAVGQVRPVPVDPATVQVKVLTLDLAVCLAFLRRPPMPEGMGALLQSAEATLRGIARGDIPVQTAVQDELPVVDKGATVVSDEPHWDGNFWGGFRK